jgi:type II secretory pathway pseudopilin PulG
MKIQPPRAGHRNTFQRGRNSAVAGFSLTDLLMTLAVLALVGAVAIPMIVTHRRESRLGVCLGNLKRVNQAVLQYAAGNNQTLPAMDGSPVPGGWWHYREKIKTHLGLSGPASPEDRVFACPEDRGYGDGPDPTVPFWRSKKHVYTSYVFNGVNLPGIPNIGGRSVESIVGPDRTLLVLEWTAHAPLSWHRSRTGKANTPFYRDAESVVGFVDGHVALTKIFYDGLNAAYTRDPALGYTYKFSGN